MFFVVESQKLVNSVVVNVEKERKKERLLEGVKNIANTCKYHVLEAGEDEKQRKYRVVEVEKVKKLRKKCVFVVESCGRSIPRGSICRGVKRGKKLGE